MTSYSNSTNQISLKLPLLPDGYSWQVTGNVVSEPWDLPLWYISLCQEEPQVGSFEEGVSFVTKTVTGVEVSWDQDKLAFPREEDFILAAHQTLKQTPEVVALITLMLSGVYVQNNTV